MAKHKRNVRKMSTSRRPSKYNVCMKKEIPIQRKKVDGQATKRTPKESALLAWKKSAAVCSK